MCLLQNKILENGFKTVLHSLPEFKMVAICFFIRVGARYETKETLGLSHFIEHMLFKGSKHYSFQQISQKIEGKGGNLNAYTTEETTVIYAKVFPHDLLNTLKILKDLLFYPLFDSKEMEKERDVIFEEISACNDQPTDLIQDYFSELIWEGHPLSNLILGRKETLRSFQQEDLFAFHQHYYCAANTTLSIAGPITESKEKIFSLFDSLPKKEKSTYIPYKHLQTKPRIKLIERPLEQSYLQFGFATSGRFSEERWSLHLLVALLGGQMCSKLYQEIREFNALAYSIDSDEFLYEDVGSFYIRCDLDRQKVSECVERCLDILTQPITQTDLEQAKWVAKGGLLQDMESPLDFALWNGECCQAGQEIISIEKYCMKLEQTELEQVHKFVAKYFRIEKLNLLSLGSYCDLDSLIHLSKIS
jgi:predicted Zn-dependent peptidase